MTAPLRRFIHALLGTSLVTSVATATFGPPSTERRPVEETIQGETFVDDYRWLESLESEDPEVRSWTDAQNAYTEEVLHALPCRATLAQELSTLMNVPSAASSPCQHRP